MWIKNIFGKEIRVNGIPMKIEEVREYDDSFKTENAFGKSNEFKNLVKHNYIEVTDAPNKK